MRKNRLPDEKQAARLELQQVLLEATHSTDGKLHAEAVEKYMKKIEGKVINGHKFVSCVNAEGETLWQLKKV